MAVTVGNIREWIGEDVIDPAGGKIGSLESVYVDTVTDEPFFVTVSVGGVIGGRRLVFVPLTGATVGPGHLRVAFDKKQVRDAPAIETDGELPATREAEVFGWYGMAYDGSGPRRLGRR